MKKSELKKPFSLRDFEAEKDRNERLRMCIIQPEFFEYLKHSELEYFNQLYQAFGLVYQAKNLLVKPEQVVKTVIEGVETSTKAAQIVEDMHDVFDFGGDKMLKAQRIAAWQYELALKAQNMIQNVQDADYVSKIVERAAKQEGLDKVKVLPIDKSKLKYPERVILTSNPNALNRSQEPTDIEDESE